MALVIVSIWLALGVLGMFSYICKKEDVLEKQVKIEKDVKGLKEGYEKHKKPAKVVAFVLLMFVALLNIGIEYLGFSNAHSLLVANHAGLAAKIIFEACLFIVSLAICRTIYKMGKLYKLLLSENFRAIAEMGNDSKKDPILNCCRILVGVTVLLVMFS